MIIYLLIGINSKNITIELTYLYFLSYLFHLFLRPFTLIYIFNNVIIEKKYGEKQLFIVYIPVCPGSQSLTIPPHPH